MPRSPLKICPHPGCTALTRKSGCEKHPRKAWRQNWSKSRQERGYGRAWEKQRLRALKRDNYLCIPCQETGYTTPATIVDHKIPKAEGGTDDMNNLQSICSPCHKIKTQEEAHRGRGV